MFVSEMLKNTKLIFKGDEICTLLLNLLSVDLEIKHKQGDINHTLMNNHDHCWFT